MNYGGLKTNFNYFQGESSGADSAPVEPPSNNSPKFRFGPLVWRSSRERSSSSSSPAGSQTTTSSSSAALGKKSGNGGSSSGSGGATAKAARNAKCNSGDSGVQVSFILYSSAYK